MSRDVWLDDTGDIEVDHSGDLRLAEALDCDVQTCAFRIKTDAGELVLHSEIGASLGNLIGEQLTPDTLNMGESMIYDALTFDGSVSVSVTGVPLDRDEILFVVEIQTTDLKKKIALTIPFDFAYGINLSGINAVGTDTVYS